MTISYSIILIQIVDGHNAIRLWIIFTFNNKLEIK